MGLNKFRAGQIKDADLVTEAELHAFQPAYNIFLTKVSSTSIKVTATSDAPASLTINNVLRFNTADTSNLTISGASGTFDIFAIGDSEDKNFTLAFATSGQNPEGATNYRKIGEVDWDGSAITAYRSISDDSIFESHTPSSNGQTIFTLTDFTYKPNTNNLEVYVNGIKQVKDLNYSETNSTTVTFLSTDLTTDDNVLFVLRYSSLVSSGGSGGEGGSGEANTASNVGTGGVGVFKQKNGTDLEFKKINAGSNKVTVTDDTDNSEVDIDIDLNNANLNDFGDVDTTGVETNDVLTFDGNNWVASAPAGGAGTPFIDDDGTTPATAPSATGSGALAIGSSAVADKFGQKAFANGHFSAAGDAQGSLYVLRNSTSDTTLTSLFLDGSSAKLTVPDNTAWCFDIQIIGRASSGANHAGYKVEGIIYKNGTAASTTIVNSVKSILAESDTNWDVTVEADTTNGALDIKVSGAASTDIKWVAFVKTSEVTFA